MNENVAAFFERYEADEAMRERVRAAVECYPGSLEIREPLVREVLLPEAEALGLGFTTDELLAYEQELWTKRHGDEAADADEIDDEDEEYWILCRGWYSDEASFCGD